MFARYRISFNINLFLGVKEDLEISLEPYERAKLFLHPSQRALNTGEIVVEVAKPNETFARNYAEEILQEIFFLFTIEKNTTVGRLNIEKIDFENREDFKGVREARSINLLSNATFIGSLNQGEFLNLGDKFQKIHALDLQKRELLLRFLRVYNSGRKGRYPSDELIYRWIALEVIISNPNKRQKTWNSINNFISQPRFPVDRAKDIVQKHDQTVNELINENLHDFERNNNYSELLKEELQKLIPHWKEVLKYALRCIYEVRNGVIHRSEEFDFVPKVNNMLDFILRNFWEFRSPS